MWTRLAGVALSLAGVAAQAQPAADSISRLDSCIQAARLADISCSKIADPVRRTTCLAQARSAQLECFDRAVSGAPEPAPPASLSETTRPEPPVETARPEPPVETAPPPASAERPAADASGRTRQPEASVGGIPADETAKRSDQPAKPSHAKPAPAAASLPPPAAEGTIGAIQSNRSQNKTDKPAPEANWIISETTSPVDYSPLVTAVIGTSSNLNDGPNTLTVRCRARQTELSVRTNQPWGGVRRGSDLLLDYQIDDQPVVRQPWTLSADGQTVTYKSDPAALLRSIPDGATLKLAIAEQGTFRPSASFELTGLSVVRHKVGTACAWALPTAKPSSGPRSKGIVYRGVPIRASQGRM